MWPLFVRIGKVRVSAVFFFFWWKKVANAGGAFGGGVWRAELLGTPQNRSAKARSIEENCVCFFVKLIISFLFVEVFVYFFM